MSRTRVTAWLLLAMVLSHSNPAYSFSLLPKKKTEAKFTVEAKPRLSAEGDTSSKTANLSPISLNETSVTSETGDEKLLKTSVRQNHFKPDQTNQLVNKSKLMNDAATINALPLALMQSAQEAEAELSREDRLERLQVSDLWEATLTNSPDIQFVVQALQPTSDPSHAVAVLNKLLQTVVYGGATAAPLFFPGPAANLTTSFGLATLRSLFGLAESRKAKQAENKGTNSIFLYKMVRDTADRLVERYRSYKESAISLYYAEHDLTDLRAMIGEANAAKDSCQQIKMFWETRLATQHIRTLKGEVRRYRQNLVDLAGPKAVIRLDKQIEEEQIQLGDFGTKKEDKIL